MYRLAVSLLLLLFPTVLLAQEEESQLRRNNDWVSYADAGCIGGSSCTDRRLRVALEDRPVIAVRFHAHDQVGSKAEGVLRVKVDGTTVKGHIDIPRAGETFSLDVDELIGRYLVFEPVTNDEVEIRGIQVLYGRSTGRPRDPYRPGGGGGGGGTSSGPGWRAYPRSAGCIGGDGCRKNGNRITIALDDQPVLGVRFFAHDNIGQRAGGRLTVRIDNAAISSYIDVLRDGKRHEIDVDSVRGSRLVIETSSDDEVEIRDIEVLYGRGRRGGGGSNWQREVTHEGGCIGGGECGGRRARIRVPIYGRSVAQIRFYARDDVGQRAGGELRIRIDDEIVQDYLDITREGRTYTFDGRGLAGDYLYFEPAQDDEVMVREIRVTFVND